ncbi:FAD-binding oxidoreductase [Candidatus Woesearchaeota archaeon]|nr:FAD-binding oxidoreductase [Candidatus Woesearchaeota archaeon]
MKKRLANIVGTGNSSDNPLDLEAYSYCSSETEQKPALVVWPQNTDQVRRIMLYANQTHNPVVIRGSGASKADACIGENTTILSSERMNKILKLDLKNKVVEVEAGMRIKDFNNILNEFKMSFPLRPFNPVKTIGGMLALDLFAKESHQAGSMRAWVNEVEFVDGTGKYYYTKKRESVLGKEGLTGFITRAKLRITEQPTLSIDIFKFTELSDVLKKIRLLKNDVEIYFSEFIDKKTAQELGFENNYLLITAYSSLKGKKRDVLEIRKIIGKINFVHSLLRSKGGYYLQDPFVSLEKSYDLIQWCEKHNARLHGHAGLGLFYAYFSKEDKNLIKTFRSFVRRINGTLGRGMGYGVANKDFVNPVKKKELIKLKDEHDYNNILNPNKMISYR